MLISFDKTGFPLVVAEGVGVEVHLLPITKTQFAKFAVESPFSLAEPVTAKNYETLFAGGILADEALDFARWLGEGFDLPTVDEWRAIYRFLKKTPLPQYNLSAELVDGEAGAILDTLADLLDPNSMLDFSLMRGGLVEWVRHGETLAGLGAPRPEFHPNLWEPLRHTVTPIRPAERLPYFGLRLVRRGEWYLSDQGNARFIY